MKTIFLSFCGIVLLLCHFMTTTALENQHPDSNRHVLTVFVMHSLKPIQWESPSSLFRSTFKGYKAKLLHHRHYLLKHMIARLESPLIGRTKYSAMVSHYFQET